MKKFSSPCMKKEYSLHPLRDKITVILFCNLDKISRPDAIAKQIAGYFC
ncbi:hypothetical protein [Dendronalium phyllosphericum]|nr:hypothetical protein [Dendronalium phyllosphericum]